ncbi:hypothetical protein KC332_g9111 [Hortaea werneckii]|uniref:STE24 endopeptidase n=2 Tax=Hortaea werneckii TaxID=91943 RepID=A0A3M7HIP9_HORWE|nr:hypothetical protein KC350_g14954 [Hortaea werneckii]OTA31183.1 hypothetical protein BTJ68_08520 [Hortaea werneckii EXF-2000]KAI6822061.1 hypothetical protein KC358_g8940 [Hortaea werneckii]KAI6924345.1 hypothetical protein KC348_g9279 [Hortaea werneckii]KAI6932901.1 hypothetical protein KC341_g8691 [Hortaea werneckii]
MPTTTPIDRAMNSRNFFFGFAAVITGVAAWSIWGGDMFPQGAEPKGDPRNWTEEEMRAWLDARGLFPGQAATKEELLARVEANLHAPRT